MTRGRRRNRVIRFEYRDPTQDCGGGAGDTWLLHCREWALIEGVQSLRADVEEPIGGQVQAGAMVRIHVDINAMTSAIDHTMRAVDEVTGRIMNVQFVQEADGRDRALIITAQEDVAN
ncbi:MAG: head-tail adaptor protein [Pseudomonadota bacterium]